MRLSLPFLGVMVFLSGAMAWAPSRGHEGNQAPEFSLPFLDNPGEQIRLSEVNRESPVLLIFWASWCPTCVGEIREVNQIQNRYGPAGLKIYGVNVEENRETILNFARGKKMDYPVLLDEKGAVAALYGLDAIPAAVLIAPGGRILYYGYSLPGNLEDLIG